MSEIDLNRIDEELHEMLKVFPALEISEMTLSALRERLKPGPIIDSSDGVEREEFIAVDQDRSVKIVRFQSAQRQNQAALLWMHGGGLVMGHTEDPRARVFAREVACSVFCVEYRLAPEHPYPSALQDCWTALKWLFENSDVLGIDKTRIAIGGTSAGGGLAASLALWNRDHGALPVNFQLLMYPMLDHEHSGAHATSRPFPVWSRQSSLNAWSFYLRGCADGTLDSYAVPARSQNYSDLPPAYACVGTEDLFMEEVVDYAGRLNAAGSNCELAVFPRMYHGGETYVPQARLSLRMMARTISALRNGFSDV